MNPARRLLILVSTALLLGLIVACGGDDDDDGDRPVLTELGTLASPTAVTGALPKAKLQRVFPNASFQNMTGMYPMPDGKRFLILEQAGRVMVLNNEPNAQPSVFLDLRDRVDSSGSEMGLLGLAMTPDFFQSGTFFVNYTAGNPRRTVIAKFVAPGGQGPVSASSEQVILEVEQPYPNHNGGEIAFSPDGYMFIGFGDGGSGNDPQGNGQNKGTLLGKMLRIDTSRPGPDGKLYRIPPDNPFVNEPDARGEIWALGLRNPWRFSFDTVGGRLWIADVGQNSLEEIDVGAKGANYGWSVMEGEQCLGGGTGCDRNGLTLPVTSYSTGGGNCAVVGGFVYRGEAVPGLRSAYVYGDYCSGKIWGLRYDGSKMTDQGELFDAAFSISSFGMDSQFEIYALQRASSGGIYKLVAP